MKAHWCVSPLRILCSDARRLDGAYSGGHLPLNGGRMFSSEPLVAASSAWYCRLSGETRKTLMPGPQPRPPMWTVAAGEGCPNHVFLTVPLGLISFRSPLSCPKCVARGIPPTLKHILRMTGTQRLQCHPKIWKSSRISEG